MKSSGQSGHCLVNSQTIDLLQKRDAVFLKQIFLDTNPLLARVCVANSVLNENADELIQQTWETFFANLEQFQGRSQISTFVCGILLNKIREYRRSIAKFVYEEDSEKILNQAFSHDGWWRNPPHNAHKLIELQQDGDMIRQCLEGLSENQKAAFVLKEIEEEGNEEVCKLLGINVVHLGVLIFRAKDKLRKCIEGHSTEKGG